MNRIYVRCLAAYNNGILHGKWISVDGKNVDEVFDEIQALLKDSPEPDAEEWAIHDSEGFEGIQVREWHNIEELVEYCESISTCDYDIELITAVMSNLGCSISEAIQYCENNYQGEYEDVTHWAASFLEETGGLEGLPKYLQNYIDFEGFGRDAELGGDIFTCDSCRGVYVLWNG